MKGFEFQRKSMRGAGKGKINPWQLFIIILFHPLEAYDIVKLERDTQIRVCPAVILIIFAGLEKYAGNFLVSFQFREKELGAVNLWIEMAYVVIPIVVWIIANFCMTSILDGESKPREIFVTAAYCLAPYIVLTPVQIVVSHIVGDGEAGFYYFLRTAALVWVILLLFFAMLRQNDYGLCKAIGVAMLCIVFMVIFMAVFIFLASLTIQFVSTVQEIFQEIQRKYM